MSKSKLTEFTLLDPFNPQNTVSGTITHFSNDDNYGALTIHSVNGVKGMKHQRIPATPKIKYPEYVSTQGKGKNFFSSNKKDEEIYDIQVYEKVDGSNIFGFVYHDANGQEFVSYKLRLRPFLTNSVYGNFYDLFNSIKPEGLDEYIINSGYNVSMELWGKANPHLIHYPAVDLQLTILFGRERKFNNYIIPPYNLPEGHGLHIPDVPRYDHWPINSRLRWTHHDLVNFYTFVQNDIEKYLVPYSANENEEPTQFIGQEGCIIYSQEVVGPTSRRRTSGNWTPFKLKPHSIEEIHWAAGSDRGISNEVLRSTSLKAIEAYEEPTVEDVAELLSEDWGEVAIGIARPYIEGVLQSTKDEVLFNLKVWQVYNEVGVKGDKSQVLRAMSPNFSKHEMTRVYSVIKGVLGE